MRPVEIKHFLKIGMLVSCFDCTLCIFVYELGVAIVLALLMQVHMYSTYVLIYFEGKGFTDVRS